MPVTDREHVALPLFEAYNAQRIAQSVGADKYAPDIMQEVQTDLQNAQAILQKAGLKPSQVALIGYHGQTILHRP